MQFRRAVLILTLSFAVLPQLSHALTLDEIKEKLLGILQRTSAIKLEIEKAASVGSSGTHSVLPCLSLGRNVRAGMEGEDVMRLQELLIKAGLLGKGKATGYYGPLTEAAVKKWQASQGIVSSGTPATTGYGVVGPKTRVALLTVCKNQVIVSRAHMPTCPAEPQSLPSDSCAGTWEKGRDAAGCFTGYQCVSATTTPPVEITIPPPPPSIEILQPVGSTVVTGGNSLTISWQSRNVTEGGGVTLSLLDATGNVVGEIARNLAQTGTYHWRVPQGGTNCAEGENAFDCIEKFARCEGNTSICELEPGQYRIRAALSGLESTSEPFQIAGTAITDVLKSLVGAPVLPPPAISDPSKTLDVNSCVHESQAYDEGAIVSVPCEKGKCLSESAGYVSGECKKGKWCIPLTNSCAKTFVDIDVSAYAGGGASAAGPGYSVACPQEGWRAYLACPYGGCTTGWNICRGGIWILDSVQTTVVVGMQGPCESGQVWCGIGTGFGCVAANQCVNGTAVY